MCLINISLLHRLTARFFISSCYYFT